LISDPPAHGNSNAQLVQAMATFSSTGGPIQDTSGISSQDTTSQLGVLTVSSLQHTA
jgi:hypothetical protein